jgi:tRNA A-37 threonylcarbamoyl transferase component Bud32
MHSPADPNLNPAPAELCGYTVDQALTPGQSYLAIGPGGRGIVLKKMDEDCMLKGAMHPSIRERLCRVRELAHGGVANLHGVGRDGDIAYLIWEYVRGKTFDEYVADPARDARDLLLLAREIILSVDSLHMQGIVHGAIGGGNIIIGPDSSVRLTHVSPLLYTDLTADAESVFSLLEQAVERRGEQGSPLGQLLAEASREQMALRPLGTRVASLLESREAPSEPLVRSEERHIRRRTLFTAALVALAGLALGYGVWRMMDGSADLRGSLNWVRNAIPTR